MFFFPPLFLCVCFVYSFFVVVVLLLFSQIHEKGRKNKKEKGDKESILSCGFVLQRRQQHCILTADLHALPLNSSGNFFLCSFFFVVVLFSANLENRIVCLATLYNGVPLLNSRLSFSLSLSLSLMRYSRASPAFFFLLNYNSKKKKEKIHKKEEGDW